MTLRFGIALLVVLALFAATVAYARSLQRVSVFRWWANILIPSLQALIIGALLTCFVVHDIPLWLYAMLVVVGVLCAAVDLVLLRTLRASEDKELEEERVRVLSDQLALQLAHLERVRVDAQDAQAVCSRIAADLEKVEQLIDESERTHGARGCDGSQLREATPSLEPRRRVCAHAVVDALMLAKLGQCEAWGIETQVGANVPADLDIPNADLCAVFSNLMDNAIAACARQGAGPRIEVSARLAKGFLLIEVRNSLSGEDAAKADALRAQALERAAGSASGNAAKNGLGSTAKSVAMGALAGTVGGAVGKDSDGDLGFDVRAASLAQDDALAGDERVFREHGWGTYIVSSIAERHDGSFDARVEKDVFVANVALRPGAWRESMRAL